MKKFIASLIIAFLVPAFALAQVSPVYDQASDIQTDTSSFDKNLSAADTDVQKALETLDELEAGGGEINWSDPLNAPYTGWTDDGTTVRLTTTSDSVGVGTTKPNDNFPRTKMVVSNGVTGHIYNDTVGLVGEGTASMGHQGIGIGGVAKTSTLFSAYGVAGRGIVGNTSDSGTAVGVQGLSEATHAGGNNIAFLASAQNGASNYSFYGQNGEFYNSGSGNFVGGLKVSSTDSVGDRLIVTTAGNVGIGSSLPTKTLTVVGDSVTTNTASVGTQSITQKTTTSAGTGGAISYVSVGSDLYAVHTFTSSGTFTVGQNINAWVVIVASGGGAGEAGGGAGGFYDNAGYSMVIPAGDNVVTIGSVGTGGNRSVLSTSGGNAVFNGVTRIGGGRGGDYSLSRTGGNGGSGGGTSQSGAGGAGTAGQGFAGGNGNHNMGGGGGGAGGAGSGSETQWGGYGGLPAYSTITGTNTCYAGGGRGYGASGTRGSYCPAGYGSGGDANAWAGAVGSNGKGGVVIIRYLVATTKHPTFVVSGGDSNGYVGIGSTSPSNNLEVVGTTLLKTSSGTTVLSSTTSGNIGIGSVSPRQKLDITGAGYFSDRVGVGAFNASYSLSTIQGITMATGVCLDWGSGNIRICESGTANYNMDFRTWTGSALTEKMRITGAGNVGIGTTTPTHLLNVAGNVGVGTTNAYYFGAEAVDGTWRIVRSGNNLVFERRESGSYVTKSSMVP